ncbi:MAG: hypothetical protein Q8N08_09515 [Methanobacteriaceae archaeon]|nr:hypothetical protein [Methanobacteriaceae archaeon]
MVNNEYKPTTYQLLVLVGNITLQDQPITIEDKEIPSPSPPLKQAIRR